MKYLIILFLSVQIVISQTGNGSASIKENNIVLLRIINPDFSAKFLKSDFNKDGNFEILSGEKIVKTGNKEYWIRNTTLTASSGDIITFGSELKINENKFMDQVPALNGYIIVFEEGTGNIDVYIANEFGSKDSDVISISYR